MRTALVLGLPGERRMLAKVLLQGRKFRNAEQSPALAQPVQSVLFVCYGNIMRSAFAGALMQREVERTGAHLRVLSAGTNARNGKRADPRAREAATKFGVSLENHGATLVTRELLDEADLIVPMDYLNAARLLAFAPDIADRMVFLGAFDTARGNRAEIADPYGDETDATSSAFERIERCVSSLLARVSAWR